MTQIAVYGHKYMLAEGRDLFILHSQYDGYWWLDDVRGIDQNANDIDVIIVEYPDFRSGKMKPDFEILSIDMSWPFKTTTE